MVAIPENVMKIINDPASSKVLMTTNDCGCPHGIVAGTIMSPAPDTMVIGEVLFTRSKKNLEARPDATFLVTKGMESYEIQVKAKARIDSGDMLDQMNKNLEAIHLHARALWTFEVKHVYNESAGPDAGKLII